MSRPSAPQRRGGPERGTLGLGLGRAAAPAASAWRRASSRVVPQWHCDTRFGTRRPQFGQAQVTEDMCARPIVGGGSLRVKGHAHVVPCTIAT